MISKHVLFVCGKNRWRSPTAEQVFSGCPGIRCLSAGLSRDADTVISADLIAWAELIFVMEQNHKTKLVNRFKSQIAGKRIICLNIPDKFRFMDPALVKLLGKKVAPYLRLKLDGRKLDDE